MWGFLELEVGGYLLVLGVLSLFHWLMRPPRVVRRPPREWKIPGSNPACAGIFLGSSHTSDFKIGTPVATLPGAWRDRVSAGTGWPNISILWLGEMESSVCNIYLSVTARKNCLSRSVLEIHSHVAGTLSSQPRNNHWLTVSVSA